MAVEWVKEVSYCDILKRLEVPMVPESTERAITTLRYSIGKRWCFELSRKDAGVQLRQVVPL